MLSYILQLSLLTTLFATASLLLLSTVILSYIRREMKADKNWDVLEAVKALDARTNM